MILPVIIIFLPFSRNLSIWKRIASMLILGHVYQHVFFFIIKGLVGLNGKMYSAYIIIVLNLALSPNKETSLFLYSSFELKVYKPSTPSFSSALLGLVVSPSSPIVNGPRTKCTSFGSCSSKFLLFRLLVQAPHCVAQVDAVLLIKHANALQWK